MKRAALIVGVNRYEDPEIQDLACAENDCLQLFGFLRKADYEPVEALSGPAVTNRAVLDAASDITREMSPGDLFLFFFAGHGVEHEGKHLLLCPDVRHRRLRHQIGTIPVDLIREETDVPGVDRVFVLDACRSDLLRTRGSGPQGMKGEQVLRDVVARARSKEAGTPAGALAVLCSCAENQQAGEIAGERHGLFTASLLGVLQEGLRAGDTVALSDALEASLAARMTDLARRHGLPPGQRPWILRSGPAPVLIPGRHAAAHPTEAPRPPRPAPPTKRPSVVRIIEPPKLRVTTVPSGAEVTIDGRSAGRSPVSVELSAGRHRVAARLEGYQDWDRQIHFEGDADEALPIELEETPRLVEPFFPMTAGEAKNIQRAAAEALGLPLTDQLDCGGGVKLRLILIPAGKFQMGSPEDEEDREDDEVQHEVTVTQPFYMGVHEVTQEQYERIVGTNPSDFKGKGNPVEEVSWEDATAFCKKLSSKTGRTVRLPTEAQWEYACRAGTSAPFHTGGTISTDEANYDGNSTYGSGRKGVYREKTVPVGSFQANAFGLYDMHGNVWEWCRDWYGPYANANVRDPQGPASGSVRVLRGGSWFNTPRICRSAYRCGNTPDLRNYNLGFRVVAVWSAGRGLP